MWEAGVTEQPCDSLNNHGKNSYKIKTDHVMTHLTTAELVTKMLVPTMVVN